ncbi:D-alanine--D-alanine ligase [Alteromonas sp. C1M14]|uniref:D-alanine--D-alanine ligase n=1 Tax=Alteromonas sp. C1M14 TaxID=2841567 RepID=UPI001C088C1A|nr:D-alanine--D-alanine ligase [Alteromonas sp. C1M14]MBU2976839.1 D-alanine--D-alanine ligase [Alteromonas sp. C1M14]
MLPPSNINVIGQSCVNAGLPQLAVGKRDISPFEFIPTWLAYTPVVLQSLLMGLVRLDWALPLSANPAIKLSGMVGESKNDIFEAVGPSTKAYILPSYTVTKVEGDDGEILSSILHGLSQQGLAYPLVAKPDLGCRGVGVKLIKSDEDLAAYLDTFPLNSRFLLQKKSMHKAEAGVFYVRQPDEEKGRIISLTFKYAASVIGNGVDTLQGLIERDPRAGKLAHLYLPRHQAALDWIVPKDEEFQLAFAGSHSRGSIFKNGNGYITAAMEEKLNNVLKDFDGFHYGRLDIKFDDIRNLMTGGDFDILEINGASSEAAHIWDSEATLSDIFSTLMYQYRLLYQIGYKQKQRGVKTPSIKQLLLAWQEEKRLVQHYPITD